MTIVYVLAVIGASFILWMIFGYLSGFVSKWKELNYRVDSMYMNNSIYEETAAIRTKLGELDTLIASNMKIVDGLVKKHEQSI